MLKKTIILIVLILAVSFLFWRNFNSPADRRGKEQAFKVSRGETVRQIAGNLEKENLIKSPFYFRYLIWRRGLKVQAGEYIISPSLRTSEIIKMLTDGQVINREKIITIIEGWDIKDVAVYLEKNQIAGSGDYLKLAQAPLSAWKFNFDKPDFLNDASDEANLAGYLFPDTYRIAPGATAEQIIYKMLYNFDKKLSAPMRQDILKQNKTIYQIITMASLLEKEVRTQEDMKIVSGIFWGRIKIGMPLQSDATLSYVLGDKIGGHTPEQTKINSPYNTYKYRGLPPGPIANPGLNAIKAAIYPVSTDYNYFLSDPKTGKTIFSKILNEHNANKQKYLK